MSTNVRFYLSYDIKNTLNSHFWRKKTVSILSLCTQRCYGRHNVSQKSVSILLHGVISLSDATSYDKGYFVRGSRLDGQKTAWTTFFLKSLTYFTVYRGCPMVLLRRNYIFQSFKRVSIIFQGRGGGGSSFFRGGGGVQMLI